MVLHLGQLLRATFGAGLVLALSFHGVLHIACHDGHAHDHGQHVHAVADDGCSHHHPHAAVVNATTVQKPHLACPVCTATLDGMPNLPLAEANAEIFDGAPIVLVDSPCRAADGFIRRYQGRAPPTCS